MIFYCLNDGDVHLYACHKANRNVSSNEFTSCVIDSINQLPAQVRNIILIPDGCAYQNRNRVSASDLRDILSSHNKVKE